MPNKSTEADREWARYEAWRKPPVRETQATATAEAKQPAPTVRAMKTGALGPSEGPPAVTPEAQSGPRDAAPDAQRVRIVLTNAQCNELAAYLGKNIATSGDLITRCQMLTAMSLDGYPIRFEPALLTRLQSRCRRKDEFPQWLSEEITRLLHGWVGY